VWYADATDQRGSFDTTLAGSGLGTSTCPGVPSPPPPPPHDAGSQPDATPSVDGGPIPQQPDAGHSSVDGAQDVDASGPVLVPVPPADESPDASTGPRVLRGEGCGCRTGAAGRDQGSIAWLVLALFFTFWGRRRRSASGSSSPSR
jgi:MYXO-CTERM domain-containing protein